MTTDSLLSEQPLFEKEMLPVNGSDNNKPAFIATAEKNISLKVFTRLAGKYSETGKYWHLVRSDEQTLGSFCERCKVVCAVSSLATAGDCIEALRQYKQATTTEDSGDRNSNQLTTDRLFVLSAETQRLLGYVLFEDLLFVGLEQNVMSFMRKCEVILHVDTSLETAARRIRNEGVFCAPVVDSEDNFVGIVNALDIIREVEFEAAEDFMRVSGLNSVVMSQSYFETPFISLIRGRLSWLVALLLFQSISSVILGYFEELIERHVVIALFLTMLIGTGGNAGNQSSAIVIRGLATGEIHRQNAYLVISREFRLAVIMAFILSIVAFFRVFVSVPSNIKAALTVSIALFLIVISSIVAGAVAPLLLEQCGADPAYCASPALATATDVIGVLLICTVATIILGSSA
jgi:Mg2+ transporter MgtE